MSQVGLCLSKSEGAMFASIEYLLCGLPIVSTKSVGGRDIFFTDENCIIADLHSGLIRGKIAESVQHWLDNYPDISIGREKIRETQCVYRKDTNMGKFPKIKLAEIIASNNLDIEIEALYKKTYSNQLNWTHNWEDMFWFQGCKNDLKNRSVKTNTR